MIWVRKIHKWVSLVVGIQFLLWLLSGFYFNLMNHHKAGGHQYRAHMHHESQLDISKVVDVKEILSQAKLATSATLIELLGQPYYLLNHEKGLYPYFPNRFSLYHAYTGEPTEIDKEFASKLALQSYNGPGELMSVSYLAEKLDDIPKQKNASWRIDFNDDVNTSVYVEAETGRIVGHSDDDKRFADIFFMLHFMDYGNHGNFNSVQMILFAFGTLWLSTTGIIWTVDLALRGQYKLKWLSTNRKVKLFDKHQHSLGEVVLSTHGNLLSELEHEGIILPSSCGGGGTCGRCQVMMSPNSKVTSADIAQFNQEQLDEGYRLACQHFANDVEHMTLMDVTDAKKVILEVLENRFVSPDIKELRFKVKNAEFNYKAGAFMRFLIPAGQVKSLPVNIPEQYQSHWQHTEYNLFDFAACSRSYSIANVANCENELSFIIKMQKASSNSHLPGVGSNFMGNLQVGESIEALGPFEDFFVNNEQAKIVVLVGAGSGMAPLKAIIEEQLAFDGHKSIVFIYGARSEQDLIYQDEFYQLANTDERFTYLPTLSQPGADWSGAQGYAQQILELNLSSFGELDDLDFYLCGPKGMMEATIDLLKRHNVDEERISFDDFS
ncbi:2Fe-2S iron-sulfur cluster-binding protein [Thalassotalea sp. Y01]|uniref:2Fe-2S iron-sulfur cluster-binding protein n=1 Tax=Thalassotalea sp. Y01 TaxID=2729613 RepID=UPI00145E3A5D|nr:2Fe-2S iron-sulfur cluster-binding protein [Thalassotalea sp. Y01]NMP14969.1 2Fe-2S iron-sulfur cluster binding domain-containing protein [Thalassotalea sp. Y01]